MPQIIETIRNIVKKQNVPLDKMKKIAEAQLKVAEAARQAAKAKETGKG
jgi:hypothetical protein